MVSLYVAQDKLGFVWRVPYQGTYRDASADCIVPCWKVQLLSTRYSKITTRYHIVISSQAAASIEYMDLLYYRYFPEKEIYAESSYLTETHY